MEHFCNNLVKYFENKNFDNDQLISHILKDIYQNDIIYIQELNIWKEYKRNKWINFDMNFKQKIHKTHQVLEKVIQEVIDLDIEDNKKRLFLKKIFALSKNILQYKYNIDHVQKYCKELFSI